jgi:hypothetical protein
MMWKATLFFDGIPEDEAADVLERLVVLLGDLHLGGACELVDDDGSAGERGA